MSDFFIDEFSMGSYYNAWEGRISKAMWDIYTYLCNSTNPTIAKLMVDVSYTRHEPCFEIPMGDTGPFTHIMVSVPDYAFEDLSISVIRMYIKTDLLGPDGYIVNIGPLGYTDTRNFTSNCYVSPMCELEKEILRLLPYARGEKEIPESETKEEIPESETEEEIPKSETEKEIPKSETEEEIPESETKEEIE